MGKPGRRPRMSYIRALIESHGGNPRFVEITGATERSLGNWKLNGMSKAEGRYVAAIIEQTGVAVGALMNPLDVVSGCVANAGGFDVVVAKTGIPAQLLRKYIARGSMRGAQAEHVLDLANLGKVKASYLIEDKA